MPTQEIKQQDSTKLYRSDEYLRQYPDMFERDSRWKLSRLSPLLDKWVTLNGYNSPGANITIMDVGGGSGLLFSKICAYLQKQHNLKINKIALDLSPAGLKLQQQNNPDIKKLLQEDICNCSLPDKEVDLTLMIDVLEHVPDPQAALRELSRISQYVLFKVPLEDNWLLNTANRRNRGMTRKLLAEKLGHINTYNMKTLLNDIRSSGGTIKSCKMSGVYGFMLKNKVHRNELPGMEKWICRVCRIMHHVYPALTAKIYTDFALVLVKY